MSDKLLECLRSFSVNFLTDISDQHKASEITERLIFVAFNYLENPPKDSLVSISEDFKTCVETQSVGVISTTVNELGNIIIYLVILTALFMVLLVVILGLLSKITRPDTTIGFILFFTIIYVVVGWVLINNTFNIISTEITKEETIIDGCFENYLTAIDTYFRDEESAINNALCTYPPSQNFQQFIENHV